MVDARALMDEVAGMAAIQSSGAADDNTFRGKSKDVVHESLVVDVNIKDLLRTTSFAVSRPELGDFDCYLLETNLASLIMEGLEELSKTLVRQKKANPLRWLAQYMLRHRPATCKDTYRLLSVAELKKTPTNVHEASSLHARKERGRRELRRCLEKTSEGLFRTFSKLKHSHLTAKAVPRFAQFLDDQWNLGGQFSNQFSKADYDKAPWITDKEERQKNKDGDPVITLEEYNNWLMKRCQDDELVLLAEYFWEGTKEKKKKEALAARQKEEGESLEASSYHNISLQKKMDECFEFCYTALDTKAGKMLLSGDLELSVEASSKLASEGPHIKAVKKLMNLFDKAPPLPDESLEEWLDSPWDEETAEL